MPQYTVRHSMKKEQCNQNSELACYFMMLVCDIHCAMYRNYLNLAQTTLDDKTDKTIGQTNLTKTQQTNKYDK